MEITMGKQALCMQRKRKWVKKTKIGCEQELVELRRVVKSPSHDPKMSGLSHWPRANFATTSKPQHNFSYYLICINCGFKSLPEVRTDILLFINHCRNGRYYLHRSALSFHFISKHSHYLQNISWNCPFYCTSTVVMFIKFPFSLP